MVIDPAIAIALIGGAVVYFVAQLALHFTQAEREPHVIETTIPFFTPFKVLVDKTYFAKLRERYSDDIYTLRIPKLRVYVINSLDLISAVEKEFKILTFQAILDQFSRIVCELSPAGVAAQDEQTNKWLALPKSASEPNPTSAVFHAVTSPQSVREMSRVMLKALGENAEKWAHTSDGTTQNVKWLEWITELITNATTDGVYGPKNPYRDPQIRAAFWKYHGGIPSLVPVRILNKMGLGWLGRSFVQDTISTRRFLASVFERFFSSGDYLQGSDITRERYEWYMNRGFPLRDHANIEAGFGIAILSNTVPTAFWATLHILSDKTVLEACRAEVLSHVITSTAPNGTPIRTFDVSKLKSRCPILKSAFQEAMRVHSNNVSFRAVREDYVLNNKYMFKKGNMIMMPASVRHFDSSVWGPDPQIYQYDRFLKRPVAETSRNFRAWGGGTTKCPGRHFATLEILIVTTMLLLRFDVTPVKGTWQVPTTKKSGFTTVMPYPDWDVDVNIKQRNDDEGVKWVWEFSKNEMAP